HKESKYNDANNKIDQLNHMGTILNDVNMCCTYIFYDAKTYHKKIVMYSAKDRFNILSKAFDIMNGLKNVHEVIRDTFARSKWYDCVNNLDIYRGYYSFMLSQGQTIDTAKIDENNFNKTMYEILDLREIMRNYINKEAERL